METYLTLAGIIVTIAGISLDHAHRLRKRKPAPIATSLMIIGVPMRQGRDLGDWH